MTEPASPNRREHERYQIEIKVDWSTRDLFVSNHVTNISRGGLFIQCEVTLPLGAELNMVLWPPGGQPIRALGRVVWSYDVRRGTSQIVSGAGIRFIDISAGDWLLLEKYLAELAQGPPVPQGTSGS
jgi:uncharacterized protein (TIGR02266 family)